MAPTQDKEKKSKLGRIFGSGGGESSKKDQHINQDGGKPQTLRPSAESVHDSAYASSENANKGSSGENIVHVDNKGQIDGVDQDRSLAYNKSTGDVFDEDTGETVVTTTTTTTTTTTHRPGGRKELKTEVKTDGGEPIATAAAAGSDPGVAELPASRSPAPPGGGHDSPPVPVRNPHRRMSREGEQPVSPQTQTSPQYQMFNPPPAPGGPTGHSPQEGPPGSAGPAKTNFSYPSRTEPPPPQANMGPPPEQQPGYRGTMDNLKAAAAGIHGVGETLRGTLNSEADKNFMPRSNPKKAAAADAKNQAALDKGRSEMAGLRARNGLAPSVSPSQQPQQPQDSSPPPLPQQQQQQPFSPNPNYPPPPQSQIHPAQRDQPPGDSLSHTTSHPSNNTNIPPPPQSSDYPQLSQTHQRPPIPQQAPPHLQQQTTSPWNPRPQPSEYGVPYPQNTPQGGGPAGGGMPPEHYGPYQEAQPHRQPGVESGGGEAGERKHGLGKLFRRKPVSPGRPS